MKYGHIYVASCAIGANYKQTCQASEGPDHNESGFLVALPPSPEPSGAPDENPLCLGVPGRRVRGSGQTYYKLTFASRGGRLGFFYIEDERFDLDT